MNQNHSINLEETIDGFMAMAMAKAAPAAGAIAEALPFAAVNSFTFFP